MMTQGEGRFDPPQLVQAQAVVVDDIARQLDGLLTSIEMHTDEQTTNYANMRLHEVAAVVWRALSLK